jgi:hypothetical protein
MHARIRAYWAAWSALARVLRRWDDYTRAPSDRTAAALRAALHRYCEAKAAAERASQ